MTFRRPFDTLTNERTTMPDPEKQELDAEVDSAVQKLRKTAKKARNPSYDVFRYDADGSPNAAACWERIAEAMPADSGKDAIGRAVVGMLEAEQYGTFGFVRHGEFKVLTRSKKVIESEEWS